MYGYKAFYSGREFEVYATNMYDAKQKAIAYFKVPRSKQHMVSIVLCEKDGETVTHKTSDL